MNSQNRALAPGLLPLTVPESPDQEGAFLVQGEVVRPDGRPLPNYIVRAFDRAICAWRPLTGPGTIPEVRTNEDGRYRIVYDSSLLSQWGKTRADLKVEVYEQSGEVTVKVAESPLILQALPREIVNFAIGKDLYRGPDEYTRVVTALAPFLGPLNDLACLSVPDVLILARQASLPTSSVAYYIKAGRWSAELDAPAEMFYGLMRRHQPTRLDALLARPLPRLWAALVDAKNENIIDLPLDKDLRGTLAAVQQQYLAQPEHPHTRLLTTTALTSAQQAAFTQRLITTELAGDEFWRSLAEDGAFSAAQVADLRHMFDLQAFVDDNTSLTIHLRRAHHVRVPREVAAFSVDAWRDTVLSDPDVEIPDAILPGENEAARRAGYAQMLYRAAERQHSTASLAGQMARSATWAARPVSAFLAKFPDFEFNDERVTWFLQAHPEATSEFPDAEPARAELLRVEQLFHLTPGEDKLEVIQPLWDAGLRSAPQIACLGRQHLLRLPGGLDRLARIGIYRQAVHVTSLALSVYMRFNQRLNSVSPYVIRAPQLPKEQTLAQAARTLPEWETLFGSTDACECAHNDSVLGPPAYLVDIMAFLLRAVSVDDPTRNALDELLDRRPDLGTLQLTSENADTELPQIDIVCQTLENIVASADHATLSGQLGQTTWDSAQLAAQPEHLDPVAYEILRGARYPFGLPFDLWLEESRRYLKQMGIARDELMQRMPPRPDVGALEIAIDSLGMSVPEAEIIRDPSTRLEELAVSWGVDLANGTLRAQLAPADALMRQAGIDDYDALIRLLNTRYVNPDSVVTVSFADGACSLEGARLTQADGSDLTGEQFRSLLDRLHRFLRLQRRLKWTEYEVDLVLAALGVEELHEVGLFSQLAAIEKLRTISGSSIGELCSWWSILSTFAFEDELPSAYEEAFLDVAAFPDTHSGPGPDLLNDVFALTPDRTDLAITISTDATLSRWLAESDGATPPVYTLQPDYAAYIQTVTRLTAEDLLRLVEDVLPKDAATGHVALNLANVSIVYRMASFTRGIASNVTDTLTLLQLTGIIPLTTATSTAQPADSLNFHTRFLEINAGPFSIEQLAYFLLHDPDAAAGLAPAPEDMDAWLTASSPAFTGVLATSPANLSPALKASLTQSLGSTLGLDSAVLDALLFTHRPALGNNLVAHLVIAANPDAPNLPTPRKDFHAVFETVHKFGLVWNGLGLDPSHLAFVLEQGTSAGWTDIASLAVEQQATTNFGAWQRLVGAADLQTSVFTTDQSLFGLMQAAIDATSQPTTFVLEDFLAQISLWSGWSLSDLRYLTGPGGFNLTLPDMMQDERPFVALRRAIDAFRSSGSSAEQVHGWTVSEPTFAEAQSIKQALMLSYDAAQWLEVLGAIQDELRPLRRDALLGYLLHTLGFEDSTAFYHHYLLDPDHAPCARTSRIAEAHSAVQIFAQRILFNLEPFVFAQVDADGWQWRKNYRVWEAARKVFLYPENWIEPEWRTDKSSFFKDLEDGLSQEDINLFNAERLYREYLYKLDQVSRLEILGMYEDTWVNDGVDTSVLHVFGRTRDVPQLYYYRRWEDRARWTAWERVDLDINSNHLVPVVYNGRLYLFWTDFTEAQTQVGSTSVTINPEARGLEDEIAELEAAIRAVEADLEADFDTPVVNDLTLALLDRPFLDEELRALLESWISLDALLQQKRTELRDLDGGTTVTVTPPIYEIELGMAWSQYQNGTWSAKTLGSQTLNYESSLPSSKHVVTGWVSSTNQLRLAVATVTGERLASGDGPQQTYVGHFYFDESHGGLLASRSAVPFPQGDVYVSGSYQRFQTWDSFIAETLSLEVGDDDAAPRELLGAVPAGSVDVHFAHQDGLGGDETAAFFYSDDKRTYFVEPLPDAPIGFGSFVGAQRRGGARSRVRRSSQRVLPATTHYQDASTDEIIDRVTMETSPGLIANQAAWSDLVLADDPPPVVVAGAEVATTGFRYRFTRFYHPYTSLCLRQLSRHGVDGLLKPEPDWDEDSSSLYRQLTPNPSFDFVSTYDPNSNWVYGNYTTDQIEETFDFDHNSAYGLYNFELFFHIPLLVASRLMQNQRFDEARRWFHYIFDPMCTDGEGSARFWKIKPFYEAQLAGPSETLDELIALLEAGDDSLNQQVREWELAPFDPHAIARLRMTAYMQATVRKYLDCLIRFGDLLFARDTREFVKDAAHLYLLAAEILGERPTLLPAHEETVSTPNLLLQRYQILLGPGFVDDILDRLASLIPVTTSGVGSARSMMRTTSGGGLLNPTAAGTVGAGTLVTTTTSGQGGVDSFNTLPLFCIPHNDLLDSYFATVSDRLFKIRHCMNISGQVRQLALYAPPIDPMLLVRAAAAGLDIDAIVAGLFAALPAHRFAVLLPKALELCGEVRNLGSALLAALEKEDGEALAVLRSTHEVSLLKSIRTLKTRNVEETDTALASLLKSRESAEFRVAHYGSLERVSTDEQKSLDKQEDSRHRQRDAEIAETVAAVLHVIPSFPNAAFGGPNLGSAGQAVAAGFRGRAAFFAFEAGKIGTMAGYDRRLQEWTFQRDLAAKEVEQLDKQILAAEIRNAIAVAELANHDQQMTQSTEVEDFLKQKFTNEALHNWMVSKLSSVYFLAYQMAYQTAKQAERAFQHELGPDERNLTFFDVPYWDSLKKGLTAGEQLHHDLRRLEQAHRDANRRELEITKPVSLFEIDPAAVLELRQTGACDIHIPEVRFDLDFAGHYFRRIKAVRLTIPGVAGPYTNVSATLTLTQSWTRREVPLDMSVPPERDLTVLPQTAIATCTGVNDSGMFEFRFDDPRYGPCEGAGAISTWRLELPSALRPFNYSTIPDVILHISYTARAATDGGAFADLVNSNLVSALNDWKHLVSNGTVTTPARLFSLRHEFPTEWGRLTSVADGQPQSVTLRLDKRHFPSYLDFLWASNGGGLAPHAISLGVSASRTEAILSPMGLLPSENEIPRLTLSGLSEISNEAGADVVISVEDGVLSADTWRDLYLLVPYEIVA